MQSRIGGMPQGAPLVAQLGTSMSGCGLWVGVFSCWEGANIKVLI